ncbi:MAG: hypothetical protein VX265_10435, partial [Myxococcota bacterium]|nr:hypothetical protein [Myxococcota bacterium]
MAPTRKRRSAPKPARRKRAKPSRSRGAPRRTRGGGASWTRRAIRWTIKWSFVVGSGAAMGAALVGWAVYEQAKLDVDDRLRGAVWNA